MSDTELLAPPESRRDVLDRIQRNHLEIAEMASEGQKDLIVMLVEDAATTSDPEQRRKILETLNKVSNTVEPRQQPQAPTAQLQFQIVLDPNVPQEAPPGKRARTLALVEDAVLVASVPLQDEEFSLADLVGDE